MSADRPVAVLGGTFNPVHYGHLRSSLELVERLELAELRLMPCAVPPHREAPACSAEHRARMVELAVADEPRLLCDRRELERSGPSYTVDSLSELRLELGPRRALYLVMGFDALGELDTWHRWEALLDYCHIVIIARPGWVLPGSGAVGGWLRGHRTEDPDRLAAHPTGAVLVVELRPLAISSTEIRAALAAGRSARYLLPEQVLEYIETNRLYRQEVT